MAQNKSIRNYLALTVCLAAGMLLSACAATDNADCSGQPANGSSIRISGAWAWAAPSANTAAYMVISNCGTTADRLVGADTTAADAASLHNTTRDGDMTSMSDIGQLEIPAGKKIELKSGGYHIMLIRIKREIKDGDPVDLTLLFSQAGKIKLSVPARMP